MKVNRETRQRAIQATHKKLGRLFNLPSLAGYRAGFDKDVFSCHFDDKWFTRLKDCANFSGVDLNQDLADHTQEVVMNLACLALSAYQLRKDVGDKKYDPSISTNSLVSRFAFVHEYDRGSSAAHSIINIHLNHAVNDALSTLVDDLGYTKRSALSLVGHGIGASISVAYKKGDLSEHAYVFPTRPKLKPGKEEEMIQEEWQNLLQYWELGKDLLEKQHRHLCL